MWNHQLKPGAVASPLIWLRMFWFAITQNSELFITQVAVKSHSTCTLGPLQTRFCFYFGAQVSKYQMKPLSVFYLCPYSPMQRSFESHLDWNSVLWNATYPSWPPPPSSSSHPESPVHPSTLLPPAHHMTSWVTFTLRCCVWGTDRGRGGRDSRFWAPVCETWKPTLTHDLFISFGFVCFYFHSQPPFLPPPPCPAPSFSPTPLLLLLRPFPLRCARRVRANIRYCLPSCLRPCCLSLYFSLLRLSSISFLACLSFKSPLLCLVFF